MTTDDTLARLRSVETSSSDHGESLAALKRDVEHLDRLVTAIAPVVKDIGELRGIAERLADTLARLEKRTDALEKEVRDGLQESQEQFDDWESDREQRRDRSRGFYLAAAAAVIALAGLVVAILTYAHHA